MRAVSVFLAVILVIATVAGAVPVASISDAQTSEESISQVNQEGSGPILSMLGISPVDVRRSALQTTYVELGRGLAFTSTATETRIQTETTLNRIQSASTPSMRQQRLLQALSETEQRTVILRSQQRTQISAYGDENITTEQFLARLAAIDAESRALITRISRLESAADSIEGFSIPASRFETLRVELRTLTSPVRKHATDVITGTTERSRFVIQSGPQSVVIGTIIDETYVREAYRGRLRGAGIGMALNITSPTNVTTEAYPTITSLRRERTVTAPNGPIARVNIDHDRGRLVSFIDTSSARIFKEIQHRPLTQTSTRRSLSAVKDGLRLTAHPTYPGGPVRFQLNSTATEQSVDAPLTLGPPSGESTIVGETGADGSLWTLAPDGTYQVTAIDRSSVVLVSVDPSFPPLIYGTVGNSNSTRENSTETNANGSNNDIRISTPG
jgi:hypothetical protein